MPHRLAMLLGVYEKDWGKKKMGIIPSTNHDKSMFSMERWKFLLDAPFLISHKCCNVMKKEPLHSFEKTTGLKPITAQMADESRLRKQKWLQNGCNAFEGKHPISNPMSFWTEQDVLQYIKRFDLPIAEVYGSVVTDYGAMGMVDGQMDISSYGVGDVQKTLKTTGCNRTGCWACAFGMHLEKPPCSRMYATIEVSNPKMVDAQLRGGHFCEDGLWRPDDRGFGYWFVLEWCNVHGGMNYQYPNREKYLQEYMTEETRRHLA